MHVQWVLSRIQWLEQINNPGRLPTHRNIWQGSYDVWATEQDRIDAMTIPKATMKHAEDNYLIKSELVGLNVIWKLTDKGKQRLSYGEE